ncbi:hypothetical protein TEA_005311 [Camellia sinensis var. sinensis]|uniref:Protein phosphatase n=1 Tax=Camellia sinensis var. sinensis TaxID=542762 RepID=A0A4S4EH64_CAMSN|nr:hypothetical protein TEA_005311 [Camellia sinensis var. sinensis]
MSWSRKVNCVFHSERRLKIAAGPPYLPKDDELKPRGDDAHFLYAEKQTVGWADGAGGWTRKARTNGLLDNLRESEIEEIINHGVQKGSRQLACLLANLAPYNSFDKYADTLFARTARKAGYSCAGGKVDDN